MKRLLLMLTLCIATPVITFNTGCTTTHKQIAFQTLASVGAATQKSIMSLAAGKKAGKVSQKDWDKVKDIHDNKYLPAYNLACDLAAQDYSKTAPADVIALSTYVITTVNQILQ